MAICRNLQLPLPPTQESTGDAARFVLQDWWDITLASKDISSKTRMHALIDLHKSTKEIWALSTVLPGPTEDQPIQTEQPIVSSSARDLFLRVKTDVGPMDSERDSLNGSSARDPFGSPPSV